jgi:putative ABC transport system ATP-binding protein
MAAVLTLENISKTFGQGHTAVTALHPVNLTIQAGEFVSLIGPSGSGKSTLLTIAGALQTPSAGTITVNGENLTHLKEAERAKIRLKEIGFILQSSNLVPFLTVRDQFTLLQKAKVQSTVDIDSLLQSLDILELQMNYPKELSGGEKQRVALAKALFNEPALILADEPTASLDTKHAYDVVQLLAKEAKAKQTAILMVTHDERMTTFCDHVYQMKDGVLTQKS